jgi:ribonuclease HII
LVDGRRASIATSSEPSSGKRSGPTQDEEWRLQLEGYPSVAGIDEVGRGPIAGPVVAAAVVLPDLSGFEGDDLHLIRDSKTLTAAQRERADVLVRSLALGVGIGEVASSEIDELGIAPATRKAMRLALECLPEAPSHLLIDAFPLDWRRTPCTAIIKGDALCLAISAASVIAKVYRDALMEELDAHYPGYGLAGHKGYASAEHLAAVAANGPCAIHRMSFSPFKPTLFAL